MLRSSGCEKDDCAITLGLDYNFHLYPIERGCKMVGPLPCGPFASGDLHVDRSHRGFAGMGTFGGRHG